MSLVAATVRLCIVLRQLREVMFKAHVSVQGTKGVEDVSFVKKVATTWLVVYGGEAVAGARIHLRGKCSD